MFAVKYLVTSIYIFRSVSNFAIAMTIVVTHDGGNKMNKSVMYKKKYKKI